ncbi:MAG: hypothetical protein P4L92_07100 [Rudaea sp.]|nr:hypothetical protein [Rudaea sp.]
MMAVVIFASMSLAACGGGNDGGSTQPAAKALTISMYGTPLVSATSPAVAHLQLRATSKAEAATPASGASDVQATVQTLTDALASRGVTANITAQVMDGTTLHQIVIGEDNGLPPTPDQFKSDPSEWMIVNFQLDDMVTPANDPAQQVAINQFIQDLTVFAQRAAVAGKAVFAVAQIPTCDSQFSAAGGVSNAFSRALVAGAPIRVIGGIPLTIVFDASGKAVPSPDTAHLGADCRTPDAYLQNERVQSVADEIAAGYKEAAAAASAASGASSTGT